MLAAVAISQPGAVSSALATQQVSPAAPGAPGAMSHFGLARKDCVGTARNTTSKVWFTVAGGVTFGPLSLLTDASVIVNRNRRE